MKYLSAVLNGVVLTLRIALFGMIVLGCTPTKASAPKKRFCILVDLTVDRKAELIEKFDAALARLREKLRTDAKSMKGLTVTVAMIDDRGENSAKLLLVTPEQEGMAGMGVRKAQAAMDQRAALVRKEIEAAHGPYRASRYLEAVDKALRENDEILILGDLALVDQRLSCDFERDVFCPVYDFTSKRRNKKVSYDRVGRDDGNIDRNSKITQWWGQSLWGSQGAAPDTLTF